MYLFLMILFVFSCVSQTITEGFKVPNVVLNNGQKMPILAIGTCCGISQLMSIHLLKDAIDVGYRHIDTGYIFGNELEVGLAVDTKIAEQKIKREDMFISTKLWNTFHSKMRATEGIQLALKTLNLQYIDLMLIQWPMGYAEGGTDIPKDSKNQIKASNVDYLETWEALEESVRLGYVKSIGVSNFNKEQLERLLSNAKIKPVVNQIESHPYLTQKPLIDFCEKNNVKVMAYSPLAGGRLLEDKTLIDIGKNHKKSAAQVMIRYQVQRGVAAIPRSTQKARQEEDFNVFDFELTPQQISDIDKMNLDRRYNLEELAVNHKYYPFKTPYFY